MVAARFRLCWTLPARQGLMALRLRLGLHLPTSAEVCCCTFTGKGRVSLIWAKKKSLVACMPAAAAACVYGTVCCAAPHLQAVEAAAVIHLQKGPSTCTCLTPCLDPATNTQRLTNLAAAAPEVPYHCKYLNELRPPGICYLRPQLPATAVHETNVAVCRAGCLPVLPALPCSCRRLLPATWS